MPVKMFRSTATRRALLGLSLLGAAGGALAQQAGGPYGPYGPYGTATPPPPPPAGAGAPTPDPYGAYPYPAPPPPRVLAPVDEYRASVDVYGSSQRIHNGNGSQGDNGGIGVRARFGITPNLFVDGEIQGNRYGDDDYRYRDYRDDSYTDLRQYRAGVGAVTRLAPLGFAAAPPQVWAKVQYTEFELYTRASASYIAGSSGSPSYNNGYYYYDDTSRARGPGVHVGARVPFSPYVGLYGQAGYVWLSGDGQRYAGPEFTGGIDVTPLPFRFDRLKLFAEYRYSDLEGRDDNSGNARLGDIRAGVRFGFGR